MSVIEKEDILKAVKEVIGLCDKKMPNYEMVSLRSALYELGFSNIDTQEIINYCANKGFNYCVDHTIPHEGKFPIRDVCYWGPDQLSSRLRGIY